MLRYKSKVFFCDAKALKKFPVQIIKEVPNILHYFTRSVSSVNNVVGMACLLNTTSLPGLPKDRGSIRKHFWFRLIFIARCWAYLFNLYWGRNDRFSARTPANIADDFYSLFPPISSTALKNLRIMVANIVVYYN